MQEHLWEFQELEEIMNASNECWCFYWEFFRTLEVCKLFLIPLSIIFAPSLPTMGSLRLSNELQKNSNLEIRNIN